MKKKFVEETAKKMQHVDKGDREVAKEKKRLKRLKKDSIVE
jgi:hypothetical protein